MKNNLRHYRVLARRWIWLCMAGVVICSSTALLISTFMSPVYQASSTLIVSMKNSTSAYDNVNTSLQAVPTYASLITSPAVLGPVVAQHPGLTLTELGQMMR